jgi:hypothetical protein
MVPAMPFAGLSSDNMVLADYGVYMREVEHIVTSPSELVVVEGGGLWLP